MARDGKKNVWQNEFERVPHFVIYLCASEWKEWKITFAARRSETTIWCRFLKFSLWPFFSLLLLLMLRLLSSIPFDSPLLLLRCFVRKRLIVVPVGRICCDWFSLRFLYIFVRLPHVIFERTKRVLRTRLRCERAHAMSLCVCVSIVHSDQLIAQNRNDSFYLSYARLSHIRDARVRDAHIQQHNLLLNARRCLPGLCCHSNVRRSL